MVRKAQLPGLLAGFINGIQVKVQGAGVFHHATWETWVPSNSWPVEATRASFLGLRQKRAKHNSVRATGNRLSHIGGRGQVIISMMCT